MKGGTKISLAPKKIETLGLHLSRQGNLPQGLTNEGEPQQTMKSTTQERCQ